MKRWWMVAALILAVGVPAWAQGGDEPFRPGQENEEDEDLTPEKAMELLKESQDLMLKAEEMLNDSSRGKALETEQKLLKKLEELLKDEKDPSLARKKILEKIDKLMDKAQKRQQGAVDKLSEIIRKARA